jgi:hypothetical protein
VIIKLFDKTELTVSKEVGEKLEKSLTKSSDGMVTINGYMIKKTAIAYIKPGGYTLADVESEQKLKESQASRRIGSSGALGSILKKGLHENL